MTDKEENSPDDYRARYEALAAAFEEYSYSVSHDLKTPVRQIGSFVEILMADLGDKLDDRQRSYSDMIIAASNSASAAIDSLNNFSKLLTAPPCFAPVDLNALFATVLEHFEPQLKQTKAQISCDELPTIQADRELLGILFHHLIDNALKFRDPERRLKIAISCRPVSGGYEISITDNGIGIDPDFTEAAFTMFRRLNAPEDYPGQGVGLSFARQIALLHRGSLSLHSADGGGTCALILLKADQA